MNNTPTRQTSEGDLNQFNIWMRSQPWFQEWHRQRGLNPSGNGNRKLSDSEQAQLESLMRANGVPLPDGMHIDSGGSLNQKNRLARNIGIGAAVTGAALTGLGAAGIGPMSGLFASAAPVAAGGGAVASGGSAAIPTLASTAYGTGMGVAPSLTGAATIGGTVGGAAGTVGSAGSWFGKITDAARNPRVLGAAGRMLAGASDAAAQNRGAQTAAQFDHDQLALQRDQMKLAAEKAGRDAQSDAMNKAVWGEYVANYKPSVPDEVRPYAGTIRDVSEAERQAGRTLSEQARALMTSGRYTDVNPSITPFDQYPTRPGTMERIADYAGPALTIVGLYDQFFGRK